MVHLKLCCAHLLSLPVLPAHPVAAITAVLDPVPLSEFIPHAVGMATLGSHQRDEVQRSQVHLEILFEAMRLRHDVRTPGPIPAANVKSEKKKIETVRKNSGRLI